MTFSQVIDYLNENVGNSYKMKKHGRGMASIIHTLLNNRLRTMTKEQEKEVGETKDNLRGCLCCSITDRNVNYSWPQ